MSVDTPAVRVLFPGADQGPYFNTASMALGNTAAMEVLSESLERWRDGDFSFELAERSSEQNRRIVASLIGADPADVAMVNAASTAAGVVARQLPDPKPGDNVVVASMEFTSNLFSWLMLGERGYEVRLVEPHDGRLHLEDFEAQSDGQTVVVAVSHVQSLNGFRVDLAALADIAHRVGAWFVVDGSQAAGAIGVDVAHDGIDVWFACSHKFLLGIRGLTYLYVRPDLLEGFRPVTPGWRAAARPLESYYGPDMELSTTASRLDTSLPWFNSLADLEGLRILERVGPQAIESHNVGLVDYLERRLTDHGIALTLPAMARSQIVSFPLRDADTVAENLAGRRIRASVRGLGLRVSMHLYNTRGDVDSLVSAIAGS